MDEKSVVLERAPGPPDHIPCGDLNHDVRFLTYKNDMMMKLKELVYKGGLSPDDIESMQEVNVSYTV